MFAKDDKKRLYWLVEQYLSKKIDDRTFCDSYHESYDLEIDYKLLLDVEWKYLSELSAIARRFTEFKEDLEQYPGVYFTSKELRKKVKEIREKLRRGGGSTRTHNNLWL